MWTYRTLPLYLTLKATLLQSIGCVTVYYYCPWAVMTEIEGFTVNYSNGARILRVVDIRPFGKADVW